MADTKKKPLGERMKRGFRRMTAGSGRTNNATGSYQMMNTQGNAKPARAQQRTQNQGGKKSFRDAGTKKFSVGPNVSAENDAKRVAEANRARAERVKAVQPGRAPAEGIQRPAGPVDPTRPQRTSANQAAMKELGLRQQRIQAQLAELPDDPKPPKRLKGKALEAWKAERGTTPRARLQAELDGINSKRQTIIEADKPSLAERRASQSANTAQDVQERAAAQRAADSDKVNRSRTQANVEQGVRETADKGAKKVKRGLDAGKRVRDNLVEKGEKLVGKAKDKINEKAWANEGKPKKSESPKVTSNNTPTDDVADPKKSETPTKKGKGGVVKRAAKTLGKQVGRVAKGAAKIAVPVGYGMSVNQTFNTDTETYRKRFGRENPYAGPQASFDNNGDGQVGLMDALTDGRFWSDVGTRAMGAAGDLVETATFGLVQPGDRTPDQPGLTPIDPQAAANVEAVMPGAGQTAGTYTPTVNPGSDQIGTTGFNRSNEGGGYQARNGQGSYTTSNSPGAAGGGSLSGFNMQAANDSLRRANAIRQEAINNQRTRSGGGQQGPATGGGAAQGGFAQRQMMKNLMRSKPDYDPNLTPRQNNARLLNWQAGVDQQMIAQGIDPRSGESTATGSGMDIGDRIAMAGLQRNLAKDAYDRQMGMAKFQNDQLNSTQKLLGSDNPSEQRQGMMSALQMLEQDPDGAGGQRALQMIGSMLPESIRDERGAFDWIRGFFMGGEYGAVQDQYDPAQVEQMLSNLEQRSDLLGTYWDLGGGNYTRDPSVGRMAMGAKSLRERGRGYY